MPHPLDGVWGKLERANENIFNLEREISAFLQDGTNPVIPNDEAGAIQEAVESHTKRVIPLRFSILSGEIIHHLRSCLDHIAWELSSADQRASHPTRIEFPIYVSKPIDKGEISRYERKVEGISDHGRRIIEAMQPYNRPPAILTGPQADPLWIIHEMDTTDKHRELVLTVATFDIRTQGIMESLWLMLYREADFPEREIIGLGRAFDPNSKITMQISFREFGGRKLQPVVPRLSKLTRYVARIVRVFADECF
jgi:hypothetical protein